MRTDYATLAQTICAEIALAVQSIEIDAVDQAIAEIEGAARIFVFGEGRSGLALRMGAMRLVHLNKIVHVVGDATTPAISPSDLLIVGSGSGTTPVTVLITEQAGRAGARILAITANSDSRLAELADIILALRAPSKGGQDESSVQAGGSLFEQGLLVLLDTLFLLLAGDSAADHIAQRHANLE